ncbi:MAG: metallophosphoesterase family protein [Bacteroidales bacterium]|nr:metallophosphoesterase family protein [Bacteroidales bacterium]
MRLLHLSDTHGYHWQLKNLPEAEVLVHSGDFCMTGSETEALDFLHWFCDLPYKHKIFICGNHDECLYGANIEGLDENVHYLCNSGVTIEGIKFYGVPMFIADSLIGRQEHNFAKIPGGTDVLITHIPPLGILDIDDGIHYGSDNLFEKVTNIYPAIHLFGHIHHQHGMIKINETIFSNGSVISGRNPLTSRFNVIEIK